MVKAQKNHTEGAGRRHVLGEGGLGKKRRTQRQRQRRPRRAVVAAQPPQARSIFPDPVARIAVAGSASQNATEAVKVATRLACDRMIDRLMKSETPTIMGLELERAQQDPHYAEDYDRIAAQRTAVGVASVDDMAVNDLMGLMETHPAGED